MHFSSRIFLENFILKLRELAAVIYLLKNEKFGLNFLTAISAQLNYKRV